MTVTLPSHPKKPVSLLLASENHPLTIAGRLENSPAKDTAHAFLLPSKQHARYIDIEITDVRSFAYGAYSDGSVELWAAGRAGWFVIRPSRTYRPIYNEMLEAVNLLFFIADAYREPRKSGKGRNAVILPDYSVQELLEKYAIEVMGVEKGAPEAAQRMYKHRDFLLSSMLAGKEGLAWSRIPLYLHLSRKFPDDLVRIRQRVARSPKAKPAAAHARRTSLDSASTTSSLKRKRGRPPKSAAADVISIGSNSVAKECMKKDIVDTAKAGKTNFEHGVRQILKSKSSGPRRTRNNSQISETDTPQSARIAIRNSRPRQRQRLRPTARAQRQVRTPAKTEQALQGSTQERQSHARRRRRRGAGRAILACAREAQTRGWQTQETHAKNHDIGSRRGD